MAKNIDDLKKNASPVRVSVIKPNDIRKMKETIPSGDNSDRIVIDLTGVQSPGQEDDSIIVKKSLQADILNLDDPNSPINKYIDRKSEEMDKFIKKIDEHDKLKENDFIDEEGNLYEDEDGEVGELGVESFKEDEPESDIMSDNSENYDNINIENEESSEKSNNEEEKEIEKEEPEMKEETHNKYQFDPVDVTDVEDLTKEKDVEEVKSDDVDMDAELDELEKDEVEEEKPVKKEEKKDIPVQLSEDEIDIEMDSAVTEFKDINDEGEEIDIADSTEDEIEEDEEDILKELQRLATEKMKPVSKTLDIRSFTRAKKPTANLKALQAKSTNVKAASWVLPEQNAIVRMKEFLGSELELLRMNSASNDNFYQLNTRYRMIYDHIISAKPDSFEVWAKTTPYADVDHYFFCAFIASFYGTNFIPITCTNKDCKNKMSLTDNIPILSMVKFDNDEAKEAFTNLYKSTNEKAGKLYTTEIVPLSDQIAVGFKEATIYNLFEIASLDQKFKNKFSNILDYFPYIDCVYIIDQEKRELTPVGHKIYPDNPAKTTKSKIVMLSKTLNTLTIDQFGPIKAYVNALINKKSKIAFKYIIPEQTCPHCGATIDETEVSAEELVFTRYQLGALTSTSIS